MVLNTAEDSKTTCYKIISQNSLEIVIKIKRNYRKYVREVENIHLNYLSAPSSKEVRSSRLAYKNKAEPDFFSANATNPSLTPSKSG